MIIILIILFFLSYILFIDLFIMIIVYVILLQKNNITQNLKAKNILSSIKKQTKTYKIRLMQLQYAVKNNIQFKLIITIGGDGFLLKNIVKYHDLGVSFYPINAGFVGTRTNKFTEDLMLNIKNSYFKKINLGMLACNINQEYTIKQEHNKVNINKKINKLKTNQKTQDSNYLNENINHLSQNNNILITQNSDYLNQNTNYYINTCIKKAINDIVISRKSNQAAKLELIINDKNLGVFICDGIIIATPLGSSAYNLAAGGKMLPLTSDKIVITIICQSYPKGKTSITCVQNSVIIINILEDKKRPVYLTHDSNEAYNIKSIKVVYLKDQYSIILNSNNPK